MLRIATRVGPSRVIVQVERGSIPSVWELKTATVVDSMRWALAALPNDKHKRSRVMAFIAKRQDLVNRVNEKAVDHVAC